MRQEELWQGGAWEHPQQPVEPLRLPQPKRGRRRGKGRGRLVFGCFLGLIAALALTASVLELLALRGETAQWAERVARLKQQTAQTTQTTIPRAPTGAAARLLLEEAGGQELTDQEIYEQCGPSVVYIQVDKGGSLGAGSGVVMTADGYIVTNEHILTGASSAWVILQDDRVLEAKLVGSHAGSDLAVLKVEADDLTPARFGSSGTLRVGDRVVAIGNPLGSQLRGTMTQGIVSAIDRSVDVNGTSMSLIQTTAALNMGNSGGALINEYGQVVGITNMKIMSDQSTIEGLGFAIPTRYAKGIVDQLISSGEARTPALGITVLHDPSRQDGVLVQSVDPASDAFAKGLSAGDVIVAANGERLTDDTSLLGVRETLGVGDTMTLTVLRNGEELTIEVVLMDAALFEQN